MQRGKNCHVEFGQKGTLRRSCLPTHQNWYRSVCGREIPRNEVQNGGHLLLLPFL